MTGSASSRLSGGSLHTANGRHATTRGRPNRPADGFEFLDDPGDLKLRAWGGDPEKLFANAASGMMTFLFGSSIADQEPWRTETIEIEATDREALLVDWLSELLYRATSEYHAYAGFRMQELTETKLKATVTAVVAEAVEDIKAVTHHELSIREYEGGWEATVVFDT